MRKKVKEYDDMEDALDELGQVLEKNETTVRDEYWKGVAVPASAACEKPKDDDGPRLIIPKDAKGNPLCRVA